MVLASPGPLLTPPIALGYFMFLKEQTKASSSVHVPAAVAATSSASTTVVATAADSGAAGPLLPPVVKKVDESVRVLHDITAAEERV